MSITFDVVRRVAAVLLCAGLLAASSVSFGPLLLEQYGPAPAEDEAAVRAGLAVLRTAGGPFRDVAFCDPVKALLPNRIAAANAVDITAQARDNDVILCFRGAFDYDQALAAATARRLTWHARIGGDKILVFAPSAARFMAVARENGIRFKPGDLRPYSMFMDRLIGQARARRDQGGWLIRGGPEGEALFGPYLDLAPGAYRLTATFVPVGATPCAALPTGLKVSTAVSADARRTVVAARQPLVLRPEGGAGCLMSGAIDFVVPPGGARAVETPFWIAAPGDVTLANYDVQAR